MNPWVPVSGCGPSCIPAESDAAGRMRVAGRVLAVLGVLLVLVPAGAFTLAAPRRARLRYWRFAARCGLIAVGVRLEVVDHRPSGSRHLRGALIVANHISCLDILAIAAVSPARFVAKRELAATVFGPLLRCFGMLPHDRGDLRTLPAMLARVSSIMDRGRPVAVFPEGTTWCGVAAGRFRPAFFQAALDAGVPVVPIRIAYHCGGHTDTTPGFIGDDALADTLGRILRARALKVRVVVHPRQLPAGGRRELAVRCERLIRPARKVIDLETLALGADADRGYPGDRSCLSISTTPRPPRWSPKPPRR